MRVALLGLGPPAVCGVSDYTSRLAAALEREGCSVVLPQWDWRSHRALSYVAELAGERVSVVHVQYPAAVYRLSAAPLIVLALGSWAKVVTLHEWSESHPLRKCISAVLSVMSDLLIFTSTQEERAWRSVHGRLRFADRARTAVIPIGSNVQPSPELARPQERKDEVTYFGLIRPKKGLERFLELAERAWQERLPARFLVIGETPRGCERYAAQLRERARRLPNIKWIGGLEWEEVLRRMCEGKVAYLPYPDGVSERRSSLLAALSAGLAVVTTEGRGTTEQLREVCVVTAGLDEALAAIRRLLIDEEWRSVLVRRGEEYLVEREWASIARAHRSLYEKIVSERQARSGRRRPCC